MNLKFADGLSLPKDAITQKFAFLGRSGSGKTYAAGRLVESMLDRGEQVVVFDPVGVWWGLRLSADGKSEGFDIPVFGGEQGDVPIYPENGPLVAQTIVLNGISAVIDVSHFRKNERIRFMTEFGEEFFQLKKRHRSPIHLVFEEAQTFVPQFVGSDVARLVGTMEDIVKLGRNYGIGVSLVSQRPQAVNKDVLNQTEVLVVFQMTGPQERKSINGWIVESGLDIQELVDELPALGRHQKGEAFVWSPSWLDVTKRVQIEKKTTFDASKTPTAAVRKRAAKALSESDLEALRENMKAAVEKRKQEDPAEIRKMYLERLKDKDDELRMLTNELNEIKGSKPTPVKVKQVTTALPKRVLARIDRIVKFARDAEKVLPEIQTLNNLLTKLANPTYEWKAEGPIPFPVAPVHASVRKVPVAVKMPHFTPPKAPAQPGPATFGEITGPEQKILNSLAWFESVGIFKPRQPAAAFMAGYSHLGSAFRNPRGILNRKGYIQLSGDAIFLTDEGRKHAQAMQVPGTTESLQSEVLKNLPGPEQKLLQALIGIFPRSMTNEEWGAASGYAPEGSAFRNPRGKLNTLGFVTRDGTSWRAADLLFLERSR